MASPLLRDLLGDDSEDLRLLAYGMLDHKEKTLNAQIHAEHRRLANRPGTTARLPTPAWPACTGSLIYQQLARRLAAAARPVCTTPVPPWRCAPRPPASTCPCSQFLQVRSPQRQAA
ncbi:MAG: hypothetical protein R3E34_09070 [Rhodocyclaceae bacterium]